MTKPARQSPPDLADEDARPLRRNATNMYRQATSIIVAANSASHRNWPALRSACKSAALQVPGAEIARSMGGADKSCWITVSVLGAEDTAAITVIVVFGIGVTS